MAVVHDDHIELDVTEARQGRRGRHALTILIVSFTLAAIVLAVSFWANSGRLAAVSDNVSATPAEAARSQDQVVPASNP